MRDQQKDKLFDRLVKEKATCIEFAWHGFVRLYEEGEKPCECASCQKLKDCNK